MIKVKNYDKMILYFYINISTGFQYRKAGRRTTAHENDDWNRENRFRLCRSYPQHSGRQSAKGLCRHRRGRSWYDHIQPDELLLQGAQRRHNRRKPEKRRDSTVLVFRSGKKVLTKQNAEKSPSAAAQSLPQAAITAQVSAAAGDPDAEKSPAASARSLPQAAITEQVSAAATEMNPRRPAETSPLWQKFLWLMPEGAFTQIIRSAAEKTALAV